MMKRICECYFSPCGNVKKAVESIGEKLSKELSLEVSVFDFTLPKDRENGLSFSKDDIVVIGCPVYAGRVPNKLLPYIREMIKGDGSKCVSVVCYGNRSFDNALSELSGLMQDNGMKVIGGCAVVSEHSFAPSLASNRPDEEDILELQNFASSIGRKISSQDDSLPDIPGEYPPEKYYTPLKEDGTPAVFLKAVPKILSKKCISCGRCASVCPMGSINVEPPFDTTGICIKCQACIKACPTSSRYFDNGDFLSHKAMLMSNFSGKRKAEFFL